MKGGAGEKGSNAAFKFTIGKRSRDDGDPAAAGSNAAVIYPTEIVGPEKKKLNVKFVLSTQGAP